MMASWEDSTIAARRACASSARLRSVMSRVKQRVWTKRPSSHSTLESMRTSLIEPSLQRIRASTVPQRLARGQAPQDVGDHVLVDVELGDVVADVLLARVAEQLELGPVDAQDRAVRPDPVQADRGVLEEVGQLPLARRAAPLSLRLSLGDAAEDEHDAVNAALLVADRRGAVVDRRLRAVPGDEKRVIRQPDDAPFAKRPLGRVLDRAGGSPR